MAIVAVALSNLLAVAALAGAFLRGGSPERMGGLVVLAMFVLQTLGQVIRPQFYFDVDPASVIIDTFALVNFGTLAVYSNRMWPIWAASLQILSLSAHFARGLDLGISEMVYGLMKGVPTMVVLVCIIVGTWSHRRITRLHGFDPSWKRWD